MPKISTAWVGRTNVTDDRQTTDVSSRLLKTERSFTNKFSVSISKCRLKLIICDVDLECRFSLRIPFYSENVVFISQICISVVEQRPVLGTHSFASGTPLNSGILRTGLLVSVLWSPYVIGRPYIFSSCFFLLSFFPRLISAVGDWMSTILRHMVWS